MEISDHTSKKCLSIGCEVCCLSFQSWHASPKFSINTPLLFYITELQLHGVSMPLRAREPVMPNVMQFTSILSTVVTLGMRKNVALFYGGKPLGIKNVPYNIKRKLNNIQLLVIRIAGPNKDNFASSKPCMHCINYMRSLGIKKIYYSTDTGDIVFEKIINIYSEHVSMVRRFFQNV